MSVWLQDSEISRLSRASAGDTILLSEESVQVLSASRLFAMQIDGALDVTCRPLIETWRRAGNNGVLLPSEEIVAARSEPNWDGLALIEGGSVKSMSTVRVDLGGIAKGYGIDRAIDALRVPGCSGGLADARTSEGPRKRAGSS